MGVDETSPSGQHDSANGSTSGATDALTTLAPALSKPPAPTTKKGFRFVAIIVAIIFAGTLTALEGTITSTSLPSIIAALGGDELYIWTVNGYFLAM